MQLGSAPGGDARRVARGQDEAEEIFARGVRSVRVVLRVFETRRVEFGNEKDKGQEDFTEQIRTRRAGEVRGVTGDHRAWDDRFDHGVQWELARVHRAYGQSGVSETASDDAGKDCRLYGGGRPRAEREVLGPNGNRQLRRAEFRDGENGDDHR